MRNYDVVDDTGIDRRGSRKAFLDFVNTDPEAQREMGALTVEESEEADKFVRANSDYYPVAMNYHNLLQYLKSRRLAVTAANLSQAWIYLKADKRAVLRPAPVQTQQVDVETLGDEQVVEAFEGIRAARLARQARAKKYLKESLV